MKKKNPLHILLNEDSESEDYSFSDSIFDLDISFVEVRNIQQFDSLIHNLKLNTQVYVWVHPNYKKKFQTGEATSGEIGIEAMKKYNCDFNVLTRYKKSVPDSLANNFKDKIFEPKELLEAIKTIKTQTVAQILNIPVKDAQEEQNIDIAVICATDDELKYVIDLLGEKKTVQETFLYHFGTITAIDNSAKNQNLIRIAAVKQDVMGMVDCAFLIYKVVEKYKPKYLIMTGVCGGRKQRGVKVGDIIIPRAVYTYQKGKLTDRGFETRPEIEKMNIDISQVIINDYCKIDIPSKIAAEWNKRHSPKKLNPTVWFDPIACGDVIVNKSEYIEEIVKLTGQSELAGVEMESYSVLRAGNIIKDVQFIPIVIKGVMDITEDKSDADKDFAAFASAKYFYHLATEVLDF